MLLFAFMTSAQNVKLEDENVLIEGQVIETKPSAHSAKKATLMSVVLPGLGQAYNKKYWKIPIVYAGLGASVYFIFWNQDFYNDFATAFDDRQAGLEDKYSGVYSDDQLIILQNYYRNNRDLSIILAVLVYGLQVLDANIDGHLYDFDVSDDISMRIEPSYSLGNGYTNANFGMKLSFNF